MRVRSRGREYNDKPCPRAAVIDEPLPTPMLTLPTRVATLALGVLAAFVTVGGVAQSLNLAWGLWFAEVFLFFGVPWVVLSRWGVDPARLSGLDTGTGRAVAFGFVVGALNYAAWAVPLMAAAQAVFPTRLVELFDSSTIFKHQSPLEIGVLLAGVGLAAPVCEELFFRGAVLRGLMARLPPPTAIVVTALVFAAFHLDPVGFLARFEMGVVFGLLAWRSGSLWPAIAAHAANNLVSSAIFLVAGKDADGDLPWWIPLLLLVVGNALLVAAVRFGAHVLASPRPAEFVLRPAQSVVRLVAPWLGAAIVLVAGLLLVDLRGARLGLIDASHPLPREQRKDEALWKLRAEARRGEASIEAYEAYRVKLGKEANPSPLPLSPGGEGAFK
jgi:membrane protease YdiL (CAAX protease family)